VAEVVQVVVLAQEALVMAVEAVAEAQEAVQAVPAAVVVAAEILPQPLAQFVQEQTVV
jgi:hypothetical protein